MSPQWSLLTPMYHKSYRLYYFIGLLLHGFFSDWNEARNWL
jgi:hypothetical protein